MGKETCCVDLETLIGGQQVVCVKGKHRKEILRTLNHFPLDEIDLGIIKYPLYKIKLHAQYVSGFAGKKKDKPCEGVILHLNIGVQSVKLADDNLPPDNGFYIITLNTDSKHYGLGIVSESYPRK